MKRFRTLALLGLWTLVCLHPRPARAQLFLSPELETLSGYTSNRFLNSSEEGSLYLRIAPAMVATWFASERLEVVASAGAAHTAYLRSEHGHQNEVFGALGLYRSGLRSDLALDLEIGVYRDSELPVDDATWLRASPSVLVAITETWSGSLGAGVTHTRYRSRLNPSGNEQQETYFELRPGVAWRPGKRLSLWAEAVAEANTANDDSAQFHGWGVAGGVDGLLWDVWRAGAWLRWVQRDYWESYPGSAGDRAETPLTVGGWTIFRLAPWAEATLSANWFDRNSDEPTEDYQEWAMAAGLRLVYDWEPWR